MKNPVLSLLLFLSSVFVLISVLFVFISPPADGTFSVSSTVIREPYLPLFLSESAAININTSCYYTLINIPYIGSHAAEIEKLRLSLGGFTSIEQLSLVDGIGLKYYLKAAPYVRAD